MTIGETPTIFSTSNATSVYTGAMLTGGWRGLTATDVNTGYTGVVAAPVLTTNPLNNLYVNHQPNKESKVADKNVRRFATVIIVDPNENVPLESSVLFKGEEKLTDATDQELFFELDIKGLLDKHNETRTKIVDKSVKDRTEYLPAARVRDLKMVVVNGATF